MLAPSASRRATPLLDTLLTLVAEARPARIQERTWLLARCAKNRVLFALPGPEPPRSGRKRVSGAREPAPQHTLRHPGRWTSGRFAVRGRTVTPRVRVTGPWLVPGAPAHLGGVIGDLPMRLLGQLDDIEPALAHINAPTALAEAGAVNDGCFIGRSSQ